MRVMSGKSALCALIPALFIFVLPAAGLGNEDLVRAKIGIQIRSGDTILRAKSRDRLKKGDYLRIYVHPEFSSHVYVVHSDQETATLLNTVRQGLQSSTLVMPSLQQYYQVDGESSRETFTIVCSSGELEEIPRLFKDGRIPQPEWAALEEDLEERGKIELGSDTEKPFALAGNVRGVGNDALGDAFFDRLRVSSGKSIIVKKFVFQVVR